MADAGHQGRFDDRLSILTPGTSSLATPRPAEHLDDDAAERGSEVCPVTVHQPMGDVEAALIYHLQQHVLTDGVLQMILADIRSEIAAQLPKHDADTAALEAELASARAEQKRLAQAVALASDVPELVSELCGPENRTYHGVVDEREEEVLLDVAHRAVRQRDRARDATQVVLASNAMPQIGHVPGASRRICGCIGHV